MGGSWWLVAVLTAAVVATATAQGGGGGTSLPSCASKLVPCADYLGATKAPPPSCCDPLKEAVTKEKKCLCSIYDNPSMLQSFGINITQVMGLPKLCGIDVGKDPSALCKGVAVPPSSSATGSGQSPPAAGTGRASGSESGGGKNAATTTTKSTQAGLFASLAVFCACLLFY